MRVLVTAPAGIGHIHPLLPLATELAGGGHEVRFAVSPDMCHAVERAGLPATAAGQTGAERVGAFRQRWGADVDALPPQQRSAFMFPRLFGATAMPKMLADLRTLTQEWRPDLVVHDLAELAGPLLATELGVPHATHSFGSCSPTGSRRPAS